MFTKRHAGVANRRLRNFYEEEEAVEVQRELISLWKLPNFSELVELYIIQVLHEDRDPDDYRPVADQHLREIDNNVDDNLESQLNIITDRYQRALQSGIVYTDKNFQLKIVQQTPICYLSAIASSYQFGSRFYPQLTKHTQPVSYTHLTLPTNREV